MAHSVVRPRAGAMIATLALAVLALQVSTVPVGAAVVADTLAPTAPTELKVISRTKSSAITLGWVASTDDVGVAGYRMYRNGSWAGTLYQAGVDLLGTVWYDRLTGRTKGTVTYTLFAFDAAGNVSDPATLMVVP